LRISAFSGNTSDSTTVAGQICSLKEELGVKDIVFVGDRGMHIEHNLKNNPELADKDISFISALTHEQIKTLIKGGTLQLSLFSEDLAEVSIEGKRYILSINPDLEYKELAFLDNRRQQCLEEIEEIRKSWKKRCERNEENNQKKQQNGGKGKYKNLKIELNAKDIKNYTRRVEEVIKKCGMKKYYSVELIDNQSFTVNFNQVEFDKSRSLCGKYVVCTNVSAQEMTKEQVRGEYKKLQNVEHAFRDLKSDNISIRPVYHCNENQTRGHVMLCMFAYAIIKSMENILFPFLKEYNQKNKTQLSFNDLIEELKNIKMCELTIGNKVTSEQHPKLNKVQKKILEVLNVKIRSMVKEG
jgi:transposase